MPPCFASLASNAAGNPQVDRALQPSQIPRLSQFGPPGRRLASTAQAVTSSPASARERAIPRRASRRSQLSGRTLDGIARFCFEFILLPTTGRHSSGGNRNACQEPFNEYLQRATILLPRTNLFLACHRLIWLCQPDLLLYREWPSLASTLWPAGTGERGFPPGRDPKSYSDAIFRILIN